ncbi:poly-beta-1,6-N-acetyl-D-glucosamine N-deacetylase PgaB [Obesumbacterium proteus]|uniref:poly-beta-1,6-N-acetyl-D-glucosamine N-deacetylase PgaB n=1 Tax=Obesumbacterium proteus TaxID=82983 RepID=UPI001F323352|nr:poly-beta-1,6-N-acetyl-D-glucosamine N-deacetylase PgaB [Obesumbacterium proteus]MCE9883209.1 poly-beta-1,6-N-acetyl-D-glucosamine N-deacetylase PgaB [Obesumbacterium proteus]MCE9914404.1 poly-beta-1,6-N-acetyl-D-glucosamine N-deacetylase PgaB [Obesumbacterium proteus]MCE9929697.1 poly-beta-1,6-N-acetyl-D-glucosamine N-deacetylase PgaB [Obesumbacterium proteus]MCG2878016.1 poly-beta-1,6-N-acetyl-D-glucosamine N-deacetylase PgaB [Obesumbacterium proteus]
MTSTFRSILIFALSLLLLQGAFAAGQPLPAIDIQPPADPDDGLTFRVLAFHDVRDDLRASFATYPDATAIDTKTLASLFAWLKENDYHMVSVDQIIAARQGGKKLPPRSVLLSFDDGYRSFYTRVFPLLKAYGYPAVQALITDWVNHPAQEKIKISATVELPGDYFLNWNEVAEMQRSGLVEFASHTHNLHRGISANPQGSEFPAATTLQYLADKKRYETEDEYQTRVKADLAHSAQLIQQYTGHAPRIMVWPYGAYHQPVQEIARQLGMPIMLTLDSGSNPSSQPLSKITRILIGYDTTTSVLKQELRAPANYNGDIYPVERVVQVDLDYVYDADPQQQDKNLSCLLDRIKDLSPTTIYLQAFADPDGSGLVKEVYFPNSVLPMRADLFSRVSWQLQTRTGVNVFAWMPVLSIALPKNNPAANKWITSTHSGTQPSTFPYTRLSPFEPDVRAAITQLYHDLSRYTPFQGVLFHDDAALSDDEDTRPAALAQYQAWGLPTDVNKIRANPALLRAWTDKKIDFLINFTHQLAAEVQKNQFASATQMTARNLYAQPVMDPQAEQWYAQSLPKFLANYDYTALMAMPFMESATMPDRWLTELYEKVAAQPLGIQKTVFELQSYDWEKKRPVSNDVLLHQLTLLRALGARHLGYYPDDFINNQPDTEVIRPLMSAQSNVIERKPLPQCDSRMVRDKPKQWSNQQ